MTRFLFEHPTVREVLRLFPDAKLIEVRDGR